MPLKYPWRTFEGILSMYHSICVSLSLYVSLSTVQYQFLSQTLSLHLYIFVKKNTFCLFILALSPCFSLHIYSTFFFSPLFLSDLLHLSIFCIHLTFPLIVYFFHSRSVLLLLWHSFVLISSVSFHFALFLFSCTIFFLSLCLFPSWTVFVSHFFFFFPRFISCLFHSLWRFTLSVSCP